MELAFSSTLGLVTGGIVGELSDRLIGAIQTRKWGIESMVTTLGVPVAGASLVERSLEIFLQVGFLGFATKVVMDGMDVLQREPQNFAMYGIAVNFTTPRLRDNLLFVVRTLFGSLYGEGPTTSGATVNTATEPAQKTVS